MIIVSDTSYLSNLLTIGQERLLIRHFREVKIPRRF
jgi:predicted nucleic acid-binding protein